jgi:hypothetical protein
VWLLKERDKTRVADDDDSARKIFLNGTVKCFYHIVEGKVGVQNVMGIENGHAEMV